MLTIFSLKCIWRVTCTSRGNIAMTKEIEELLDRRVGPDQSQAQQLAAVDTLQKAPVGRNQLLRTLGLQHLSTDIMQPEPGMASQKVGDLDITIKKITILPEGKIKVKLGFFNHSYQQFLGAQHRPLPSLTDDKGNIFKFEGGLAIVYSNDWSQGWRNGLDLPNQANRDGVLHFISANKDINFEEIGSHFAFSLHYLLYNPKLSKITFHTVSFTDIITQE